MWAQPLSCRKSTPGVSRPRRFIWMALFSFLKEIQKTSELIFLSSYKNSRSKIPLAYQNIAIATLYGDEVWRAFLSRFEEPLWPHVVDCFFVWAFTCTAQVSLSVTILLKNSSLSVLYRKKSLTAPILLVLWISVRIFGPHRTQNFWWPNLSGKNHRKQSEKCSNILVKVSKLWIDGFDKFYHQFIWRDHQSL